MQIHGITWFAKWKPLNEIRQNVEKSKYQKLTRPLGHSLMRPQLVYWQRILTFFNVLDCQRSNPNLQQSHICFQNKIQFCARKTQIETFTFWITEQHKVYPSIGITKTRHHSCEFWAKFASVRRLHQQERTPCMMRSSVQGVSRLAREAGCRLQTFQSTITTHTFQHSPSGIWSWSATLISPWFKNFSHPRQKTNAKHTTELLVSLPLWSLSHSKIRTIRPVPQVFSFFLKSYPCSFSVFQPEANKVAVTLNCSHMTW